MGRRKISIEPIKNERNRSITFLKRKFGLFKKAFELSILCSVDISITIKNKKNNKFYEFKSSDFEGNKKLYNANSASSVKGEEDDEFEDESELDYQQSQPQQQSLHDYQIGAAPPVTSSGDQQNSIVSPSSHAKSHSFSHTQMYAPLQQQQISMHQQLMHHQQQQQLISQQAYQMPLKLETSNLKRSKSCDLPTPTQLQQQQQQAAAAQYQPQFAPPPMIQKPVLNIEIPQSYDQQQQSQQPPKSLLSALFNPQPANGGKFLFNELLPSPNNFYYSSSSIPSSNANAGTSGSGTSNSNANSSYVLPSPLQFNILNNSYNTTTTNNMNFYSDINGPIYSGANNSNTDFVPTKRIKLE